VSVLEGKDRCPSAKGAGKSICFQVPALAKAGYACDQPPDALMTDQVENPRKKITRLAIYWA